MSDPTFDDYARRGFVVMPLKAGQKVAADAGWNEPDYTIDPQKVFFDYQGERNRLNVGILTRRSGIFVLDVDTEREGHPADGFASLAELVEAYGPLPDTFTVRTRAGGLHYYFKDVPGLKKDNRGRVGAGIDIQADRAYVVAPPSWVDADSKGPAGAYTVEKDLEVADAPAWLIALAMREDTQEPRERPQGVSGSGDAFPPGYAFGAVAGEIERVLNAPSGTGNDALNTAAFNLGTLVGAGALDITEAFEELLEAARHGGRRDDKESVATIDSGLRAGMLHPRVAPDPHEGVAVVPDDGPEERQQVRVSEMARQMVERGLAKRQADKILADMAVREAKFPDFLTLPDLLAQPDDDERWIVDNLLTYRGKILVAAQNKAGKTTLVGNLVRNLADGGQFLGEFKTEQQQRIVVLDSEMGTNTMRRWYREIDVQNADRVRLVPMRGKASSFNILSDLIRSRWAEELSGADVVILDCLRPVLDALGLDENHDAGRFLEALDELMDEAGVPTYAVVHHMGHEGERARGDSRLLDWGDAVWNLRKDNSDPDMDEARKPRFFSAYGRDVDMATGQLAFEHADRSLQYLGGVTPGVIKNEAKGLFLEVRVLEALTKAGEALTPTALETAIRDAGHACRNGSLKPILVALEQRGKVTSQMIGRGTYYGLVA